MPFSDLSIKLIYFKMESFQVQGTAMFEEKKGWTSGREGEEIKPHVEMQLAQ
jgi:hypothetical protein